jgi:hypothetical protein
MVQKLRKLRDSVKASVVRTDGFRDSRNNKTQKKRPGNAKTKSGKETAGTNKEAD